MKRSGGVTASAVIAIIGSALSILLGCIMILGAATVSFSPPPSSIQPNPPVSPVTILLVESIFLIGFGVLGIVSSVALLRLRNWARTSFIVFGGLLCLISAVGAIVMVAAMFLVPEITNENIPPRFVRDSQSGRGYRNLAVACQSSFPGGCNVRIWPYQSHLLLCRAGLFRQDARTQP